MTAIGFGDFCRSCSVIDLNQSCLVDFSLFLSPASGMIFLQGDTGTCKSKVKWLGKFCKKMFQVFAIITK